MDEQRRIAAAHRGLEEVELRLGGCEAVTKQRASASGSARGRRQLADGFVIGVVLAVTFSPVLLLLEAAVDVVVLLGAGKGGDGSQFSLARSRRQGLRFASSSSFLAGGNIFSAQARHSSSLADGYGLSSSPRRQRVCLLRCWPAIFLVVLTSSYLSYRWIPIAGPHAVAVPRRPRIMVRTPETR